MATHTLKPSQLPIVTICPHTWVTEWLAARSCEPMVTLTGWHRKSAASLLQHTECVARERGSGAGGETQRRPQKAAFVVFL